MSYTYHHRSPPTGRGYQYQYQSQSQSQSPRSVWHLKDVHQLPEHLTIFLATPDLDFQANDRSPTGVMPSGSGSGEGSSTKTRNSPTKEVVKAKRPARADGEEVRQHEQRLIELRLLLDHLYIELGKAHDFYQKKSKAFTDGLGTLKEYVDKDTLDRMWAENLRADETTDINTLATQISFCFDTLKTAARSKWSKTKFSVVENQIQVVISLVEVVTELTRSAVSDHCAMDDMLPILEEAMGFADTQSNFWKSRFRVTPATTPQQQRNGNDGDNKKEVADHAKRTSEKAAKEAEADFDAQ
ncbi:hypothetical protein C8034_v009911 [Colletotrichum sidae]|uniref:Uncharacterized protein n=1 Tax=Colletotrichum sidae TaxID=1347389 RepID=A0A4R8TVE6_9PEZI|nr:hypothetical protein C8034_v009911 [Colletotrichum sidae]